MAQQTHGIHGALPHQHDAVDAANRAAQSTVTGNVVVVMGTAHEMVSVLMVPPRRPTCADSPVSVTPAAV